MEILFVAAGSSRGLFQLIRLAFEGDVEAIVTILGIVVVVALIFYLRSLLIRQKGRALAKQLGGESTFYPNPPGEDRVWSIESCQGGLEYQIDAIKYGKHYMTALVFSLPIGISWSEIAPYLRRTGERLANAEIDDFPGEVTLRFPGLGGDPDYVKGLFGEIADGIKAVRA